MRDFCIFLFEDNGPVIEVKVEAVCDYGRRRTVLYRWYKKGQFKFGRRLKLRLSAQVVSARDEVGNEGYSAGRGAQMRWRQQDSAGCVLECW